MPKENIYKFDKALLEELRSYLDPENDDDVDLMLSDIESEIENALKLIKNDLLPANIFNTPDWVRECHERLKQPSWTPTLIGDLVDFIEYEFKLDLKQPNIKPAITNNFAHVSSSESMERLETHFQYDAENSTLKKMATDLPSTFAQNPIDLFIKLVNSGVYPPPEIILSVTKCFELYLQSHGQISLEEAFFGKPVRNSGNYSRRAYEEEFFTVFYDSYIREKHSSNPPTLNEFAKRYLYNLAPYEEIDLGDCLDAEDYVTNNIGTFLRKYHRWKKANKKLTDK